MSSQAVALEEPEQVTAERYESLIRIAASVRSQKDPKELFAILAHELRQALQFDGIAQFDEASQKVAWHICSPCRQPDGPMPEIDTRQTIAAWVFEHQEPIVLGTLDHETRFPASVHIMREVGLQSVCAFPLTTAHRRLGSIVIASMRRDAYTADEVRFCHLVADQIALAMDDGINFRASQQAQERLERPPTSPIAWSPSSASAKSCAKSPPTSAASCSATASASTCPSPEDGLLRLYALDFPGGESFITEVWSPRPASTIAPSASFRTGETVRRLPEELESSTHRRADRRAARSFTSRSPAAAKSSASYQPRQLTKDHAFPNADLAFLGQIARQVAIAIENALAFEEIAEAEDQLAREKIYLEDEIRTELKFEEIVGKSAALRKTSEQVETVAPTDSTVLIYGETGTGKELIARAIHNFSARQRNAFVKLNCAAIPTGLLESELFGHERGAFTGAIAQRIGRFELANHGTIFLDEVGEIPLELQPKLLRVLQEREFERLGRTRTSGPTRASSPPPTAIWKRSSESRNSGRISSTGQRFPVHVPSLRERPEDIPLLVRHFVQQLAADRQDHRHHPSETMTALLRYRWPGNIREFQNVIERAVILTSGPTLRVQTEELRAPDSLSIAAPPTTLPAANMRSALEEAERQQILAALEKANWIVAGPNGRRCAARHETHHPAIAHAETWSPRLPRRRLRQRGAAIRGCTQAPTGLSRTNNLAV